MKTKNLILVITLLVIVIAIFYIPLYQKYYLRPTEFKKELFKRTRGKTIHKNVSNEKINNYVECVYELFKENHNHVDNFPKLNNIGRQDVKIIFLCQAEHLKNENEKKFIILHLDSLVNLYLKKNEQYY